jgi:hypothetical protein
VAAGTVGSVALAQAALLAAVLADEALQSGSSRGALFLGETTPERAFAMRLPPLAQSLLLAGLAPAGRQIAFSMALGARGAVVSRHQRSQAKRKITESGSTGCTRGREAMRRAFLLAFPLAFLAQTAHLRLSA